MRETLKNSEVKSNVIANENANFKKAKYKNKFLNALLFKDETYHRFQVVLIIVLVILLISTNLYYFISFLVNGFKM